MALSFTPKVGQVLECDFGQFGSDVNSRPEGRPDFNRRLPPEMVKNRLVIVLNGRLSRQSCIVVPLSSSQDLSKTGAGVHVEIDAAAICAFDYFARCRRWAKADCVHTVSNRRLRLPTQANDPVEAVVELALVRRIQRAAMIALNASALLVPINEHGLLIDVVSPHKSRS